MGHGRPQKIFQGGESLLTFYIFLRLIFTRAKILMFWSRQITGGGEGATQISDQIL